MSNTLEYCIVFGSFFPESLDDLGSAKIQQGFYGKQLEKMLLRGPSLVLEIRSELSEQPKPKHFGPINIRTISDGGCHPLPE